MCGLLRRWWYQGLQDTGHRSGLKRETVVENLGSIYQTTRSFSWSHMITLLQHVKKTGVILTTDVESDKLWFVEYWTHPRGLWWATLKPGELSERLHIELWDPYRILPLVRSHNALHWEISPSKRLNNSFLGKLTTLREKSSMLNLGSLMKLWRFNLNMLQ